MSNIICPRALQFVAGNISRETMLVKASSLHPDPTALLPAREKRATASPDASFLSSALLPFDGTLKPHPFISIQSIPMLKTPFGYYKSPKEKKEDPLFFSFSSSAVYARVRERERVYRWRRNHGY